METYLISAMYNDTKYSIIYNFAVIAPEEFTSKKGDHWTRHGYSVVTSYSGYSDPQFTVALMQDTLLIPPFSKVDVQCDMRGNVLAIKKVD